MTGDASTWIDRLMSQAEKAQQNLRKSWEGYSLTPGTASVSLETIARAWDSVDRLRIYLVGDRDHPGGLLGSLTEELGPRIPRTAEGAQTLVEGVGRVIRHSKADRTVWRPEEVIPAVSAALGARLADDPMIVLADADTGEAHPPSEIVRRACAASVAWVSDALGATPSKAWKVGALQSLGLDPDDYRERTWSGFTVRVERGVGVPPEEHDET